MKVLVSGASGFVGKALVNNIDRSIFDVIRVGRSSENDIIIDDLGMTSDFQLNGREVNVVIHCAARSHVMNETSSDSLAEFRKINLDGSMNLARQAAASGVGRFIFLSSIKVNGEATCDKPFTSFDSANFEDPYGQSKFEAEQGLIALAKTTGMEVTIIRPPLVYGPGVRANFASMIKWVNKRVPLPLGAISNKRSLLALDNLVSFIICCIDHPKAANEIFLISDGEDVSTTELLNKVSKALGKKPSLIPVPVSWMNFIVKLVGKGDVSTRLFCSLQVDSTKARDLLGWKPVITMDAQLKKTADAYLKNEKTF
jgi:nucleoside-diphosphate-sugar epimerase